MDKKQQLKKEELEQTLAEKAVQSIGISIAAVIGIILLFMLFLGIFMKGVVSGWF
ncbi:MAG: hypothetical protein WC752_04145 [Patescibacteria group bacterium]|jgi:tetrahydromethanopterin S-methyltransferase subunit G